MKVELSWESIKNTIQGYIEKKTAALGDNYCTSIRDNDENEVDKTETAEQFEYVSDSHWWLCFGGIAVFVIMLAVAGTDTFPYPLSSSEGWWSETILNWQNIVIFLAGVPLLSAIILGYIGSKFPTIQKVSLNDIRRWDLYRRIEQGEDYEGILSVFYNDEDDIEVKSFKEDADHLAAEIATDLSSSLGDDKITLTVRGKTLITPSGKKFCEYCGTANPDDRTFCEKCGANLP